jgi:hypothetical protein
MSAFTDLSYNKSGDPWWIHEFFHPFVIDNLGEMMGVMAVFTTSCTREIGS